MHANVTRLCLCIFDAQMKDKRNFRACWRVTGHTILSCSHRHILRSAWISWEHFNGRTKTCERTHTLFLLLHANFLVLKFLLWESKPSESFSQSKVLQQNLLNQHRLSARIYLAKQKSMDGKKEQPNQNGWTVDRRAQRLHTNTHKWASLASNVLRTRCHVEHWHFAWILVTQHESKCYLMHHNFLLAMRNGIRHRALLQMKQACWIYHLVVFFCVSLVGAHDAGSRMDRTCAKEFERIRFESPGKYETFALRDSLLLNIASNRIEFKSQQNVENYSTTDSQDHLCDFVQKRRETSKISWICTYSHMLCLSCNKFSCYSPSDFIWN